MSNPAQENIDERDLRIIILEQSHSFNNVPGAGVSPHYISNQQGALLEGELIQRMRVDPTLMNLVQDGAPASQVATYLQGRHPGPNMPQYPANPLRSGPQEPVDIHSSNNRFNLPFAQNIKHFFSVSFGCFSDMFTNVFSRVGVGEDDNHSDGQMHNIEQSDDHSFSWANSISNLGLLFNTIINLSAYLWTEQVSPESAAEMSQENLSPGLVGEEQSESE